jgi:excisionase family DNA binding protein
METATDKLAYTIPEAAKAVGVCKATIWNRIKDGDLKSFKWSGRTLIRRDVLQAALDRASTPPAEAAPLAAADRTTGPKAA